jgi:peptide/nickel transport system permease protein
LLSQLYLGFYFLLHTSDLRWFTALKVTDTNIYAQAERARRIPLLNPNLGKLSRELVMFAITIIGLTAVTFLIGRILPADPVLAIVGDRASQETYEQVYRELGLDKPLIEQYFIFLKDIMQGKFGRSIMTSRDVLDDLLRFFPATIELSFVATFLGVFIGIPLGVIAAVRQGKLTDHTIRVFGLFGYSMPIFWLGMISLLVFYAKLHVLPGPGRIDIFYEGIVDPITGIILFDSAIQGEWDVFINAASHLVLPGAMLATFSIAYLARLTRSFMLDQLNREYVITARVKGLSEASVIWRHVFRNVFVQLITVVALTFSSNLEGAVLTETVFAWPGVGLYITQSLFNGDMNAVIGGTIVVGIGFISINRLSDFLYRTIDPRTR